MGRRTRRREDWLTRFRGWLTGSPRDGEFEARDYPVYLACRECSEPEIEVWNCDEETRCHACGALITCEDESSTQGV